MSTSDFLVFNAAIVLVYSSCDREPLSSNFFAFSLLISKNGRSDFDSLRFSSADSIAVLNS